MTVHQHGTTAHDLEINHSGIVVMVEVDEPKSGGLDISITHAGDRLNPFRWLSIFGEEIEISTAEGSKSEEERALEKWRRGQARNFMIDTGLRQEFHTVRAVWRAVVLVNRELRAIVRQNPHAGIRGIDVLSCRSTGQDKFRLQQGGFPPARACLIPPPLRSHANRAQSSSVWSPRTSRRGKTVKATRQVGD